MYNFDPYNVLLAIATNIPVLLMTGSRLTNIIWDNIIIVVLTMCDLTLWSISQKPKQTQRECTHSLHDEV